MIKFSIDKNGDETKYLTQTMKNRGLGILTKNYLVVECYLSIIKGQFDTKISNYLTRYLGSIIGY